MIFGYLEASFILGEPSAMEFAIKSLNRLLALNFRIGEGMYHFYDGQPQLKNQLSDQAQMTKTLCQAYQCTGNVDYLARAEELVEIASRTVYDSEHGGFFDTLVDLQAPGFLSKPAKPLEENSPAARALIILHNLTGKEKYRQLAEGTLKRFVEIYPQFSFMAAEYAIAADCFLNEPTTIQIIGSLETPQTKGLLTEAHRLYKTAKGNSIPRPAERFREDCGPRLPCSEPTDGLRMRRQSLYGTNHRAEADCSRAGQNDCNTTQEVIFRSLASSFPLISSISSARRSFLAVKPAWSSTLRGIM